jgi:hypothetical protein
MLEVEFEGIFFRFGRNGNDHSLPYPAVLWSSMVSMQRQQQQKSRRKHFRCQSNTQSVTASAAS